MMAQASILTIAVPVFNGIRHLAEALNSLIHQTPEKSFQLLIADDRSEDGSLALAQSLCGDQAQIVTHSERLGLAGNWNRCVELTKTPWIWIFHQDDVAHPEALAARLAVIQNQPQCGLICSAVVMIDDQGSPAPASVVEAGGLGSLDRWFEPGELVRELAWRNPLRCSSVVLNVNKFRNVGGFNPQYRYAVDWEAWLRMARTHSVQWLAKPTISMRWHLASETHRFKKGVADLEEMTQLVDWVLENDGADWSDSNQIRERFRSRIARAYLNRAYEAAKVRQSGLTRQCLRKALEQDRRLIWSILKDPRLAARLAWGSL